MAICIKNVPPQIFLLSSAKIFEGTATFGAALLDLGVDKDRVEAVEEYFDKINPFDEVAASTGIGKITELIVNIGVPGGVAFKAASGLGKAALNVAAKCIHSKKLEGIQAKKTEEKLRMWDFFYILKIDP